MMNSTLLIGLDGATNTVLAPLFDNGTMPFLKSFVARGTSATLKSVIPPLTPPAWTTVMTGRSPGHHGIFDFFRFELDENNRHIRVVDARDIACETIWSITNRHGLRATVLNFPLTSPPQPIEGHILPGWVPWRHLRLASYPPSLYDNIKTLPEFDPRELAMDMSLESDAIEGSNSKEEYENWIKLHIRREKQWFNITRHLMKSDPSPLTAILFDGIDKLQHFVWRFLDPACFPQSPTPWEIKIRQLCFDYFREVDNFIEELVTLAGPDANTVMVSDHGFCGTQQIFHINSWLAQKGYLTWDDQSQSEPPGKLGLETMARRFYEVDWDKTRAYCPTPSGNGIYIVRNEDQASEETYTRLLDQISTDLLTIKDPVSGESIVSNVWTRDEAFDGTCRSHAPDLTLGLRDNGFVSILPSDELLTPRAEPTGTHHPDGVIFAGGPAFKRGFAAPTLSITDVAPTLLHSLGLGIPGDFDGVVPTQIFDEAYMSRHPVRIAQNTLPPQSLGVRTEPTSSANDGLEIERRLQALGYVE